VFVDRGQRRAVQSDDQFTFDEFGDESRLRDHGDVGSVEAALHALAQIAHEVGAARVVDLDPGRPLETT
jgi:hypothetical protein